MSRLSERIRFIVAELACLRGCSDPKLAPCPTMRFYFHAKELTPEFVCVGLGKLEVRNSWRLGFRVQNSAETRLEVLNFARPR
jgi:hypothetical protein